MIIKENDFYTALYTMEGLTAWIKTAENESTLTGNIDTVVTELIITKANTKEIVFKRVSYGSYICFYNTSGYNNIADIIEDILLYLANSDDSIDLKERTINSVLSNEFNVRIKEFKNKYYDDIKTKESLKKAEELKEKIKKLDAIIDEEIKEINTYDKMIVGKPCEYNNYNYEIITSKALKVFYYDGNLKGECICKENIIKTLKEYKRCIVNKIDPTKTISFDKVI